MLDDNNSPSEVMRLIKDKTQFLTQKKSHETIRWWDGTEMKARYISDEEDSALIKERQTMFEDEEINEDEKFE